MKHKRSKISKSLSSFRIGVMVIALGAMLTATFGVASTSYTREGEDLPSPKKNLVKQEGRDLAVSYAGKASWYGESNAECMGCSFHRITKCGVKYDERAYTLASNDFPCGTVVWIVYGEKRVLAQVNDTGGFRKYGRIADLSKATFAQLSDLRDGIIEVQIIPKALLSLQ